MKKSKYKTDKDKLNLGCGRFKKKGFLNMDIDPDTNPDLMWDLDKTPYPFDEESFLLIEADHVLEHLNNPFKIMKELNRILKLGGKLIIKVPHASRGFTHADHKRGFDVTFPLYFDKKFQGGYAGIPLKLKSMRLTWSAQPYLKKVTLSSFEYFGMTFLGKIFDFFANSSPYVCSRLWCYWVGGFEEIKYVFEKQ